MKNKTIIVSFVIILIFLSFLLYDGEVSAISANPQKSAGILYVKPGSNGNCNSWADACELQTAIYNAGSGDQIWVASGTYKPTITNDRTKTFHLVNGVAIYGGFPAAGGTWSERNWAANVTTLSGEIALQESINDNSYHVVSSTGADGTAVLDGFTISGGNANGGALDNSGGGLYNSGGSPTLKNLIFSANAATFGGGIYNRDISSPVLENIVFISNRADHGGGIYNDTSSPTLAGVTFTTNTARINGGGMNNLLSSPVLNTVTFSGNKAEGTNQSTGGGMYNSGSSPTLTNVTFSGNSAYLFGPNGGGGMYNFESSPNLANVTFVNNTASRGAGMSNNASSPTLVGGSFSGNSAYIEGGGMYNTSGSAPTLTGTTFTGNKVYGYTTSSGGGMYNINSNPTLTNVTFSGNLAKMDTSPLYCSGGGMFNESSNPVLTGVTFSNNSAGKGGGLYNSNSSPIMTDLTFTGNSATGTDLGYGGGGMYNSGGSPVLDTSLFENNTAVTAGGGMYNSGSSPILEYIDFSGNSGVSGGGIYSSGGQSTLTNVIIRGNTASYGGGMICDGCGADLMNVTFSANNATYHGGAVYNASSGLSLTNVTISDNTAAIGGGMYNGESTSHPALTNVTIFHNNATSGGAIYNKSAYSTIKNSIIWGNTNNQIYPINPAITYSDIQGWIYGGTGNISSDPLIDPLANNGGFITTNALRAGSPAIDTGNPTLCPVVDGRGYTRPIDGDSIPGARCDMGAYEYGSSPASLTLSVEVIGSGTVTKVPDKPTYGWGEVVYLTASDDPDWVFDGWSGDASGMVNPLRVTITKNMNITASFLLDAFTLNTSASPEDSGTVTRVPDQPTYHSGDEVTITAVPNPGWSFTGWTGDATGNTNPLTVTMESNLSVTANFTQNEYSLTVLTNPLDAGSVTKSPNKPIYYYGETVVLTASPVPGWHFVGWSGDATGTANPLTFSFTDNANITANFSNAYNIFLPLTLNK